MKKLKRIFVFMLLFALVFSELPNVNIVNAAEANNIVTGKCGESVYYELNRTTGLIRIYGSGEMEDYRYKYDIEGQETVLENQAPWIEQGYSTDITKVVIEEGVTYIGSSSFSNKHYAGAGACTNIQTVDIAETVTEIGSNAFNGCEKLTSILIPNQVVVIGSYAFDSCSLENIQWGDSIQKIGYSSFKENDFIKLDLPEQTQYIGQWAFSGCRLLEGVVVPDGCEVCYEAFSYCDLLRSVNFGKDCRIHGKMFWKSPLLSDIAIGEGSTGAVDSKNSDDYGVFQKCTGLHTIMLPDSWGFEETNGIKAYTLQFDDCTNLEEILFRDTNNKYKSINGVVYSKDGSKLIYYPSGIKAAEFEIPDHVTTIGISAFDGQRNLENVIIPEGVNIEARAFQDCEKLNNVIIPEGVTELKPRVFAICKSLKTIVLPKSLENIDLNGKASTATFTSTDLEVVYSEVGSYSANWAAEKFRETIYCFFDASGGSVGIEKKPVIYGDKYRKLPIPEKEGHKFLGWYTKKEAGIPVSSETAVSEEVSHTLYAHWAADSVTKKSVAEMAVTLELTNDTYDGTEKKPSVIVKDGTTLLVGGTDYLFSYLNNINAGTAAVQITGIGNYTGTIAKNFTISAKTILETNVALATTTYTYDGTAKQPSVTVKDGSTTLERGTDYSVSYSNNVNVGTATVTITGKGNYKGTVTKTFTINAKIVEKKPFVWGESNWNFDNTSRYFSNHDVNSDVMNKMKKDFNLSNSDIFALKKKIANDNKSGFKGSCFGMTISEILVHQGELKLSRYGGNDIVNKNANTSNMTSVINFIQELQSNSKMCQSIRQTPFLYGDYTQKEFISKLSDAAANSNYLMKLSYKIVTKNSNNGAIKSGYHAVLIYGIEKCNYYSSITGKTYDRKILIADPNYLSGNIINDNACLYFKSSDSSWIIPYWNETYSNGNVETCYWNAESGKSTSNGGIRNIMQYVSLKEEVDLMAEYNAGHYIAGLAIDNMSGNISMVEKVKDSGNPNIDYAGEFSEEIARYDIDMDDDIYMTENEELYALWNPTASYTLSYLKPSDYNLKMDYETVDYYADVTNSTYTLFKPNGSITLRGADASYDITMVTDDAGCVTDWYAVNISGSGVDNLVYTKAENGYILSASKLDDVKISVEGEDSFVDVTFSTNYDDVFIYEIDKNTVGIAVDADNNGSYETTIETKGNSNLTDKPGGITSPTPTNESDITTDPVPTNEPNLTTSPAPTNELNTTTSPALTNEPNTTTSPMSVDDFNTNTTNSPLKGTILKDSRNIISYKVLIPGKAVEFCRVNNKKATKIIVPATVTINGITYKVTAISVSAFSGCKKLKFVTIGQYVTSIGDKAFFRCLSLEKIIIPAGVTMIGQKAFCGCKKIKSITIKAQKLKSKSVGSKAFKGIYKKAEIKVPKKQKKSYNKWLKKKGIAKTVKIK